MATHKKISTVTTGRDGLTVHDYQKAFRYAPANARVEVEQKLGEYASWDEKTFEFTLEWEGDD